MINLNIRLPEETHAAITQIADQEQRSLNKQIVFAIQKYIQEQKQKKAEK